MDTIQIEVTNACDHRCSNCTRLVGHHRGPYFMRLEMFKEAVDSLLPVKENGASASVRMVGVMGGEPLLHPQFGEICKYLSSKVPPERCGLWSCLPKGGERHREAIVKTFGNVFLNDQTRDDILHCPVLVPSKEVPLAEWAKWVLINDCWVQNSWSASVNPHGAFFCEVAGALSMLLEKKEESLGWKVEPGWWLRTPKDYTAQVERYCALCGCAMPLAKRPSVDGVDDISPEMYERLRGMSPKIAKYEREKGEKYPLHNLKLTSDQRQMATYKDAEYRAAIAKRYGMFLEVNERGFDTPYLLRKWNSGDELDAKAVLEALPL